MQAPAAGVGRAGAHRNSLFLSYTVPMWPFVAAGRCSAPYLSVRLSLPSREVSAALISNRSCSSARCWRLARAVTGSIALDSCSPDPLSGSVEFMVVSFYKFVRVDEPAAEVEKHLEFLEVLDVRGRIYINEQGINAQYSGPSKEAMAYADWLRQDPRFSDIFVQTSPASGGHAFPRLKLRYKPSLVQLEGGVSHLPVLHPSMRAKPLKPSEWKKRLQARNCCDLQSSKADKMNGNNILLLDVRNGYEWDVGHFYGAARPNVDCFRSTSFGISEEESCSDPLQGVDKENTDVLMYCTGGIRCDVYSTILREKGFKNLYTLSGGVSNYLQSEGPAEWVGNLFVFDGRLSLPPSAYKPTNDMNQRPQQTSEATLLGKCRLCGSQLVDFRHRNCANLDCNLLFLCCSSCVDTHAGCCGLECMEARRRRPVLLGHQRYKKWHIYRDSKFLEEANLSP